MSKVNWISLKESVPKKDMLHVLVCNQEEDQSVISAYYSFARGVFYNIYGLVYLEVDPDDITHWAEFPKVPKTQSKYREKNAEKIKAQKKEYYAKNAEKINAQKKEYMKEYYEQNREKCKAYQKEYYEQNTEKCKAIQKEYRARVKIKKLSEKG